MSDRFGASTPRRSAHLRRDQSTDSTGTTTTTTTTTTPPQLQENESQEHLLATSSASSSNRSDSSVDRSLLQWYMTEQDPGSLRFCLRRQPPQNQSDQFDAATPCESASVQRMQSSVTSEEVLTTATTTPSTPPLQKTQSQEDVLAVQSPSTGLQSHSSPDWPHSPGCRRGQDPGYSYHQLSPSNLDVSTDSEDGPLLGFPEMQRATEGGDEAASVWGEILAADSSDSDVLSIISDNGFLTGKWRYRVKAATTTADANDSVGALDVTTDSEVRPLLGSLEMQDETKDEDEAATNEEGRTASATGDTEFLSSSSDDNESLDVKLRSCVHALMTSSDTENSGGTLVTTELPESTLIQMKEPVEHIVDLLSGAQQSSLPMATARVGSAIPQLVESVQTTVAQSAHSPNSFPLNLLPSSNAVPPAMSGLPITSNTQFVVVTSPLTYQLPGAQQCDSVRQEGSVPITGTTYLLTRSPCRSYPNSVPFTAHPTNQSANPTIFMLPTSSTQVTGVEEPYSLQFSGSQQTISAVKTTVAGSENTREAGSASVIQTTYHAADSLLHGQPDSSPVTTSANPPVQPIVTMLTTSRTETTASTSSVKISMLSNLSDFCASTAAQCAAKSVDNTIVQNVTHKEPVFPSVTKVGEGAGPYQGKTPAAGDTRSSSIKCNNSEFVLTKPKSQWVATFTSKDANNSHISLHNTEFSKLAANQTAESSSDPGSTCQKPASTMKTRGVGSAMAERVKSVLVMRTTNHLAQSPCKNQSSSITTPPPNVSPNLMVVSPNTELSKPAANQMAESSSDPGSTCQKPASTMDTRGVGPAMAERVESVLVMRTTNHLAQSHRKSQTSSITTPAPNLSPKLTVVASPASSAQIITPTSSVEISMLSNLSDFCASSRPQREVSKAKMSHIGKETTPLRNSTTRLPSLQLGDVALVNSNQPNLLLKRQVPQPSAVTEARKFITQSAEVQPLDLSWGSTSRQPPPPPPRFRLRLPPPSASPYAINRHFLHTGTTYFPVTLYGPPKPPPGVPEGTVLLPQFFPTSGIREHTSAGIIARRSASGRGTQSSDTDPGVTSRATRWNIQRKVPTAMLPSTVSADPQSVSPAPDPISTDDDSDTAQQQK